MTTTRVVFMGTPEFAVPSLKALHQHDAFDVVGVVTQPDRPAGRGKQVRELEVKQAAKALGLPIFQPKTLRTDEAFAHLEAWQPDVIVVAAFGQILRQNVLDLPPYGCINVHASLLPRWRGAAPIQYAIRAGDKESGVTIMKMDAGLDTGPIFAMKSVPIEEGETASSLHGKLSVLGAELLPDTLLAYVNGETTPTPQPYEGVTLAPSLNKKEGHIDWSMSAAEIDRLVRAFDPWPGAYTFINDRRLKVLGGQPKAANVSNTDPGTLVEADDGLGVVTGGGLYLLENVQPAGKQPMSSEAFKNGHPDVVGQKLNE